MKVAAYVHGPTRVYALGNAFAAGCRRHGVQCELQEVDRLKGPLNVDVVWMYGLGPARPVFDAYDGRATRLIGDRGYWNEYLSAKRYWRFSFEDQQPNRSMVSKRALDNRRLIQQGMQGEGSALRGRYILICGMGPKQAERLGFGYGEWERQTYQKLRKLTDRLIVVREKPKCPPIRGLPPIATESPGAAIRGAWAVVCKTGNIGADCILEGVPVIADAGPGALFELNPLESINVIKPMSKDRRQVAMNNISHWHWQLDEIERGELWNHLKEERLV